MSLHSESAWELSGSAECGGSEQRLQNRKAWVRILAPPALWPPDFG